jgi:predicted ATPase
MHLKSVTLCPETYPTRDCYPFSLQVFQQTGRIELPSPVVLFVGENGTGKSTLLQALARASGIHIWRDPERGRIRFNPHEHRLFEHLILQWADGPVPGSFFGSETFRDFAEILDEWAAADAGQLDGFGGKSLVTQSHGQSYLSYFRARYRIRGLYLLDEPETALSPRSQLQLVEILTAMSGAGHAQFVVATHSPILLACPGATILSFDHVPVTPIAYEQTDHYRVYREFLARQNAHQ